MTLHLRPETAEALIALAGARGMSVEDYLEALVNDSLAEGSAPPSLSPHQWVQELHQWAESHSGLPVLADADMSRERIYADHGL